MEESEKVKVGEEKKTIKLTLFSLLGGDFLLLPVFRRQIKLVLLIVFLFLIYISNRYSAQQEQVEIYLLKDTLMQARYSALARSSELMKESRQSYVQKFLEKSHSDIKISDQSPFVIEKDK